MKKPQIVVAIITSIILFGTSSLANADRRHKEHRHYFDYARVTHVTPIYQSVKRRVPVESCWVETVAVDRRRHDGRAVVGGLVGAAIGHKLGHRKSEKRAGAIAGAIIGATIADNHRHRDRRVYREVERCDTHYKTERHRELIGYDVTYRYRGELYSTRTDSHPGDRLRVKVSVRPVH